MLALWNGEDSEHVPGRGGDAGIVARFPLTLSERAPDDIAVRYTTGDRTATAPQDYPASSGMVTSPAGRTSGVVTVPSRSWPRHRWSPTPTAPPRVRSWA